MKLRLTYCFQSRWPNAEFSITVLLARFAQETKVFNISLSARTVPQRIEAFSVDVKETLEDLVNCLQYYAVILDESMNVKDTAQCMNSTFNLTQELFELVALKGRTT